MEFTAVSAVKVFRAVLFVTVRLLNVTTGELRVIATPVVLDTVALPVVFNVSAGVAVVMVPAPILPEVEFNEIETVPVNVPAV